MTVTHRAIHTHTSRCLIIKHLRNTDPTSTSNSEVPTYETVEIRVFLLFSILTAIFQVNLG